MYQNHVDALLKAWNRGDLDDLDEYVDTNTVRQAPPTLQSNATSLDELKEVIKKFRIAFPDAQVTVEEAFFQNDRSFMRWVFTGTNTGPGDFPTTGRAVSVPGMSFGRYANNKLVEEVVQFDVLGMMMQLGIIEMPAEA